MPAAGGFDAASPEDFRCGDQVHSNGGASPRRLRFPRLYRGKRSKRRLHSNLLMGNDGSVLHHPRKLVPTLYEKLAWANGDARGMRLSSARPGRLE